MSNFKSILLEQLLGGSCLILPFICIMFVFVVNKKLETRVIKTSRRNPTGYDDWEQVRQVGCQVRNMLHTSRDCTDGGAPVCKDFHER